MNNKLKCAIVGALEDMIGDILTSTGCVCRWGEVELPESLRAEIEEKTSI